MNLGAYNPSETKIQDFTEEEFRERVKYLHGLLNSDDPSTAQFRRLAKQFCERTEIKLIDVVDVVPDERDKQP